MLASLVFSARTLLTDETGNNALQLGFDWTYFSTRERDLRYHNILDKKNDRT
jgi:hypothetical protein